MTIRKDAMIFVSLIVIIIITTLSTTYAKTYDLVLTTPVVRPDDTTIRGDLMKLNIEPDKNIAVVWVPLGYDDAGTWVTSKMLPFQIVNIPDDPLTPENEEDLRFNKLLNFINNNTSSKDLRLIIMQKVIQPEWPGTIE